MVVVKIVHKASVVELVAILPDPVRWPIEGGSGRRRLREFLVTTMVGEPAISSAAADRL